MRFPRTALALAALCVPSLAQDAVLTHAPPGYVFGHRVVAVGERELGVVPAVHVARRGDAVGGRVELGPRAEVAGNVAVGGGQLRLRGAVRGQVLAGGGRVLIDGPVGPGSLQLFIPCDFEHHYLTMRDDERFRPDFEVTRRDIGARLP